MKNRYFLKMLFGFALSGFLNNAVGQTDNTVSSTPSPYCIGLTYTSNVGTAIESGNNYGCLMTQPNPTWFFLKAETSGDIIMSLSAANDIDFIVYGPFDDMNELISLSGQHGVSPESPEVDCSYSGTNNETVTINGMVAGQYYLILITNYASIVQEITLTQTSGTGSLDCSVMNQAFHNITGEAFYDMNQNGAKEVDENYLEGVEINFAPMNYSVSTNSAGQFSYNYFTEDTVDYTVTSILPGWSSTGTNPVDFTLNTANPDTSGILFGFYPDSLYYSNTLDMVATSALCVGANVSWFVVQNNGTIMNSGIIELLMDDELTYVSSSYPADSIVGDYLYFSFDSLQPFQSFMIQIISDPEITMMVGDTVVNIATLTLLDSLGATQTTMTDTTAVPALCSYDPNDKIALPNGAYQLTNLISPDTKIEYIINFQNTGTASAVNVEIRDDLSALIDESTFEFMSSSHNATVSIDSSRMISFYFEDINLPDSTTNEPMSKGYVKFRVALVSGVLPNDIVNNQARIYFDNNPPIYTNTTENILNCFILPAPVNLTYSNQQILTNIIDPNMTFVWSLNGDILVGETNSFVDVTLDGTYTVVVSNQYGCQTTASYNYVFSDLGIHANQAISAAIYPNPSKAEFGIYFAESGTYQLSILDESGRLIFADEIQENNSYIIDGATLPVGVYFVKLTNDINETSFYRIVKL
ncbi:MAG: T9SS type A sorting domain-containing protein [Crocinitomicaceae bacterium]|jgi:hypothetical protein|nr:T9SS type A sorting domain-containing protein [Crocinitomicaceae bacterium]MBK9590609.1 T9SS type A sorting domain-containing protein [Crocinitomicaceae bacterium]